MLQYIVVLVTVAAVLIKDAVAKFGITYVEGWATITPRNSYGKVAIDINAPGVDCNTLPTFVKDMITPNFLVYQAGIRCGQNPVVYVHKD